jgi:hypothetical protein
MFFDKIKKPRKVQTWMECLRFMRLIRRSMLSSDITKQSVESMFDEKEKRIPILRKKII